MAKTSFPTIVAHGKILSRPARQPRHTTHSVAYELGMCFQLDREHCLLVASMDEQGGGDLCVGNDAFIFQHLEAIRPEQAIPLNWPDPAYRLQTGGAAFLAKYPLTGAFIPLDAKLSDGRPHPAAGTGLLVSEAMTFHLDKTTADNTSEHFFEFMQVRWDGQNFTVTQRQLRNTLLGHQLLGNAISYLLIDGTALRYPLLTDHGLVVYHFHFCEDEWQVSHCSPAFHHNAQQGIVNLVAGEFEPSLQKRGDLYFLYTRGADPQGRLYESSDAIDWKFRLAKANNTVPQVLNQRLNGELYLTTNPNQDMLRNPLVIYPWNDNSFGEAITLHDQDGVRDCCGESIPFVDHAIAVNLFLEKRWRHLICYRVCDLKERSLHGFQQNQSLAIHGPNGPKARASFGGLYISELVGDPCTRPPFLF